MSINGPEFKVDSQQAKLSGPASTMSKTIIYTCEHGKCCIKRPCNLCTSGDEPCSRNCACSPCEECDQQCQEHKIGLDRTYSCSDSFTIPFYYQNLDEDARTEDTNRVNQRRKREEIHNGTTCAFWNKILTDSAIRKYHEKDCETHYRGEGFLFLTKY